MWSDIDVVIYGFSIVVNDFCLPIQGCLQGYLQLISYNMFEVPLGLPVVEELLLGLAIKFLLF